MSAAELREWRERRALTQQRAGELYGLAPGESAARMWRMYENGERPVPARLTPWFASHPPSRGKP